ncbi:MULTISPECIES: PaaI family thioesterase [unclassified Dietzia]|uniref:PaaI family thioesterase n=1 Tax=unclassified Dietzia TaxID=2617939 RepID=UPI000D2259CC|nr:MULTISPECIES: PaaI family thioesterase [unclassified Dietzia]AVZ39383.1 thioesterase [Dietzia sp. JS16-p6b]MBB1025353.1 PaaI family thioesterase [Dietzia sp. DQ12-76]MBB1028896.1 PaaI family thioesterase [Dietzia sp. DQ11-38-2]QGW24647.1 thioesterase family domain-containing protein [Dietzia sp. DQ12-45-1b]
MTATDGFPDASSEAASTFVRASGLVVDEVTATSLSGHADLGGDHLTAWGTVHGGVYASIVESAGGAGAGAAVADLGQIAVGVHNGTDFLRASTGGRVEVRAEALFQGRSQQLWDVVISQTEGGKILARGQLRLQNVPRPDAV